MEELKLLIAKNTLNLRQAKTIEQLAQIEEVFYKDINSLFSLNGVGCSLPDAKEVVNFAEAESIRISKSEHLEINKDSYVFGVLDCVNWLREKIKK